MSEGYLLFINDESTVLLRLWSNGVVEVCLRDSPNHIWGPPVVLKEEQT